MSDKYNQTPIPTTTELKERFKEKFNAITSELERRDRMQIALNLDIAFETVNRYIDGSIKDIRRLELAENILSTAKEILRLKEQTPTAQ